MSGYVRKDAVYRAAKKAGYRSRAAVKLEDLDQRYALISEGSKVVDLGCWPGGWLQVAAKRVGSRGLVVGVDLEPIEDTGLENVVTFVGDVREEQTRARVREAVGGPADLVLCDMAPKLTGVKVSDRERQLALAEIGVGFAADLLGPGGRLVIKLFSGVESAAVALLKTRFESVTRFRPPSTRKGSSEIYSIAVSPRNPAAKPNC